MDLNLKLDNAPTLLVQLLTVTLVLQPTQVNVSTVILVINYQMELVLRQLVVMVISLVKIVQLVSVQLIPMKPVEPVKLALT